jgi:hypothetical protein
VQPDDTIEHLQHEAAHLCGLEKGRNCMQLVLPKQRIRRRRQHITKSRDVKTTTLEQVGWSDGSEVLAVIVAEAEISVTLRREEFGVRHSGLDKFENIHPKFQRICELSGCSSCVVDHDRHYRRHWNMVRFNGVPADVDAAKIATEELLSQGHLPMLYKAFSKQNCFLNGMLFEGSLSLGDLWICRIESEFDVTIDFEHHPRNPSVFWLTIAD